MKDSIVKQFETLDEKGITMVPYAKGPDGAHIFSIGKGNGNGKYLKYWVPNSDEVDIKIYPSQSPKVKQAVLVVKEGCRKIQTKVFFPSALSVDEIRYFRANEKSKVLEWTGEEGRQNNGPVKTNRFLRSLPIAAPPNSDFYVTKIEMPMSLEEYRKHDKKENRNRGSYSWSYNSFESARCEKWGYIKIPASETAFLIGIDEEKHFISMLPSVVRSVKQAHEVLRPNSLSKDAFRVGEWFFDPVVDEELVEKLWKKGFALGSGSNREIEQGSSHQANFTYFKNKKYATGLVWDSREGYHKPVYLNNFHEVVRNNEVEPPVNARRYD